MSLSLFCLSRRMHVWFFVLSFWAAGALSLGSNSYGMAVYKSTEEGWPVYLRLDLNDVKDFLSDEIPVPGGKGGFKLSQKRFKKYKDGRAQLEKSFKRDKREFVAIVEQYFEAGKHYTFIIDDEHLTIAPSHSQGLGEGFGKHFVVANFAKAVRYAGECWLDAEKGLSFNNNSGTYRPKGATLEGLEGVLRANLPPPLSIQRHLIH